MSRYHDDAPTAPRYRSRESPAPASLAARPSDERHQKTACIRTFGCQMNVHDSDRMRRMIQDAGYAEVQRYEDADLVILNTCYVRENAVDRVRGHLGELNRLRREGRVKKVALTGCIGAADESAALQQTYDIDLVLGTHNTYELAEFVGSTDDGGDVHAGVAGDGGRARRVRHDNDRMQLPVQLLHRADGEGADDVPADGERAR